LSGPRVELRNLVRLLLSHWVALLCTTLLVALGSAYYALSREPVFESDALLSPVKEQLGQSGGGAGVGGMLGQLAGLAGIANLSLGGVRVDESVAVLNSREFALRFMAAHSVLQYLFPKLWDTRTEQWIAADNSGPSVAQRLARRLAPSPAWDIPPQPGPSTDDAVKRFDRIRLVTVDRRTSFIRLTVRGPTPKVAQLWANSMIDELNDWMRDKTLQQSSKAVELLSKRLNSESLESVRTAEAALLENQLRTEVMAESRREFAVNVLDPPSLPDQRYYPRRGKMVLTGALFGFVLGALLVVSVAALRRARHRRDDRPVTR
jgi:uncharacterized protein involved in exopolysaccharide biosynthesis